MKINFSLYELDFLASFLNAYEREFSEWIDGFGNMEFKSENKAKELTRRFSEAYFKIIDN